MLSDFPSRTTPSDLYYYLFFPFPVFGFAPHANSCNKLLCKPDQFAAQVGTKSRPRGTLNVRARLAICYCCDTSKRPVGCRTFPVSKCRWKWKGREKKKLSAGSSYTADHLSFLRSDTVCLGVSQCASLRLNFFFHLLSAETKTFRKKNVKKNKTLRLSTMEQPERESKRAVEK